MLPEYVHRVRTGEHEPFVIGDSLDLLAQLSQIESRDARQRDLDYRSTKLVETIRNCV